jgi:iron complex transport system substrate-binding protein
MRAFYIKNILTLAIIAFLIFSGCESTSPENKTPDHNPSEKIRLVSLSPNLTQIIFALGAGDLLVGVDNFSNYPEEALAVPRMGSYLDPDLETLITTKPDLVLILDTDEQMSELLSGVGLKYESFANDKIEYILNSIERLGELTGHTSDAKNLIDDFNSTVDDIKSKLETVPRPDIAMIVGRNPGRLQDIYVASGKNFLGELLNLAGGENVFEDLDIPWPNIGAESIIAKDPDIIIDTNFPEGGSDADYQAFLNEWNELPSLKALNEGNLIAPRDKWYLIPGAHIGDTLKLFAHWSHPDIFPDDVQDPFLKSEEADE